MKKKRKQVRPVFQKNPWMEGFGKGGGSSGRERQQNSQQKSHTDHFEYEGENALDNLSEGGRAGDTKEPWLSEFFDDREQNARKRGKQFKRKRQQKKKYFVSKSDTAESKEFQKKDVHDKPERSEFFYQEQQQTTNDFVEQQEFIENREWQAKEAFVQENAFITENRSIFQRKGKNNRLKKRVPVIARKKDISDRTEKKAKQASSDTISNQNDRSKQEIESPACTDPYLMLEESRNIDLTKDRKLPKRQKKAEQAGKRLEQAREKLPKEKDSHGERIFDEKTDKRKNALKVIEKEKVQKKPSLIRHTAKKLQKENRNFVHRKITEQEKENSGVEAAHKTEQTTELFFDFVAEHVKSKKQRQKEKVSKLEKKKRKAEMDFLYQTERKEHPDFQRKAIRKRIQKERIKREYEKAYRKGQLTKQTEKVTIGTKHSSSAVRNKWQKKTGRQMAVMGGIVGIVFFFLLITVPHSICEVLFGNLVSLTMAGSYWSKPEELDAAELIFSQKEMELQEKIDRIETDYPDYEEYRYHLDAIGHDPFTLISYLSAIHTEFTASEESDELSALFQESYTLTLTPTIERRTRTESEIVTDSVTGMSAIETREVEYEVRILEVTLTAVLLEQIVAEKMEPEQAELFAVYQETKGGLQQFASPLDFNWYDSISSYYGYRKNPITGEQQFHRGLDLAAPEGSAVSATHDGMVTTAAYDSRYGNYVVITDEKGFLTKYAHLSSICVSVGQEVTKGLPIGAVGTTGSSTGSHLHLEVLKDGMYYNPLFYFDVGNLMD